MSRTSTGMNREVAVVKPPVISGDQSADRTTSDFRPSNEKTKNTPGGVCMIRQEET